MKKLLALLVFLPLFSNAQIITTFAGGAAVFGGDGGSASAALLSMPSGLVSPLLQVDISGLPAGVYAARVNGNVVRKFVKE